MDKLYHYFERANGPLRNLSNLPLDESKSILREIKENGGSVFAAQRNDGYMERRLELEKIVREMFIGKAGEPETLAPQYFVVGKCDWLASWYRDAASIWIDIGEIDHRKVSFTYGDMFPTFSPKIDDDREYRKNVYAYDEMEGLIAKYGLPQEWNPEGKLGPERYIEAHVWIKNLASCPLCHRGV